MAEVATARAKRARSPSPSYVDTLASPLEVLLKRRRRTTWTSSGGPPVWDEEGEMPGCPASSSHHEMSSPLARGSARDAVYEDGSVREVGIERRRTRQWERLQAPQLSHSLSQPPPQMPDSSPLRYSHQNRAASHPPTADDHGSDVPSAPHLSSSPVRHQPPSSTPFRADDGWGAQERLQEWGEEYASQNSLLHSLQSDPGASPYSSQSVDMSYTPYTSQSPAPGRYLYPHSASHRTPSLPTPYRYSQRTPLDTPGLVSSPSASSDAYSPFPTAPHASPAAYLAYEQEHVRVSYEETNRLLAELNVQRLRRHSEQDPDATWMDESP